MICSQYFLLPQLASPPLLVPCTKMVYNTTSYLDKHIHCMQANVDNLIFNRCLFSSKLHSSKQLILWWLHGSEHLLYS